jgi:hypothetical protein
VLTAHKDQWDHQDHKVHQAARDQVVHKVQQVLVLKDQLVQQDHKERQVQTVMVDHQAMMVLQDHQDRKD